jgi:hypothetical protein
MKISDFFKRNKKKINDCDSSDMYELYSTEFLDRTQNMYPYELNNMINSLNSETKYELLSIPALSSSGMISSLFYKNDDIKSFKLPWGDLNINRISNELNIAE